MPVVQKSPGSGAFPIEPGAFGTVRANPRKTCPQRDATSPAPSHTRGLQKFCGGVDLLFPTKACSHASGGGFALGSPRPSPRRWLRSKVASAEVRERDGWLHNLGKESLALWHIALTIALISFRKNPSIWRYRQPFTRAQGDAELYFSSQHHPSREGPSRDAGVECRGTTAVYINSIAKNFEQKNGYSGTPFPYGKFPTKRITKPQNHLSGG
ncbi:hypothetical protein K445DRAFT_22492 [Daldinia sp. EC12]|nr:hypothetical protein K445DRAFT_22492 [Daldinia sp. EC12]